MGNIVTDSLRTRIAAAIESIRIQRDGDAARMADAVIRELQQQWRADFGYDGYSNCTSREEAQGLVSDFNEHLGDDVRDGEQAMVLHRYVTEWVADE